MTSWCPELDASEALRAELRGDPRFTDDDTPSPRFIHRLRATTADIHTAAAIDDSTTKDQP